MINLTTIIQNLNPVQQQAILNLLVSVQEQKNITPQQAGLIGSSIESFPESEIKRLFSKSPALLRATERLLGLSGMPDTGFANLRSVIGAVIEDEVESRIDERSQKTLFDLAEGE